MKRVRSWGRLSADGHQVVPLWDPSWVARALRTQGPGIAYGNGRSYGDQCLNSGGVLWHTAGLDHLNSWNPETGVLTCEAGVLLRDLQRLLVPRGWMLPVTPGTQLITVGGAIANDVHGKNHHALGSFGDHVLRLWLARSTGELIECGPMLESPWFSATVGGMGLTGVIVCAELQLRRVCGPWLKTETIPYRNLDEFFALADSSEAEWEHTVAWVDCLVDVASGPRGVFMRANPSPFNPETAPRPRELRMSFTPPISFVNRMTLRPFNTAYYHLQRARTGCALQHYESFSYPLDSLSEWNRMYGPRGFYQYQSVVPRETGRDVTHAMLREIARSGQGSFLAVLKTFGERPPPGMLSFARPGTTLALDFPNRGDCTLKLFERLDAIVLEAGGALYPAKDARMPRHMFEAGFPRLHEFARFRDPGTQSGMSRRLID